MITLPDNTTMPDHAGSNEYATVTAHFGLRAESLPKLTSIDHETHMVSWFVDGDGFADWGENINAEPNDGRTYHVTVSGYGLRQILTVLRQVFTDDDLIPAREAFIKPYDVFHGENRIAFSGPVWSEQFLTLTTLTPDYL